MNRLATTKTKPLKSKGFRGLEVKAGDRTRTRDRLITNQQLYQLSYTSTLGD